MGIYKLVNYIKDKAMKINGVNMASFGDIQLYNNKSIIAYPYVNIDIRTDNVINNSSDKYIFNIYVVDRNEPFIAYNKCELILDNLMSQLEIPNYTINYFTLNYNDLVNGISVSIDVDEITNLNCL